MMADEKALAEVELERLINQEDDPRRRKRSSRYASWPLALSVLLNIILIFFSILHRGIYSVGAHTISPADCIKSSVSPYTGLGRDTSFTYDHHSDYVSENKTLANQLWSELESIFVIAVTEDWAREKNLGHSWRFPWDASKRIYFVKVGHQLHCLKSIHEAFREYFETGEIRLHRGHLEHCLDTLRQDLMCYADDTPMPSTELINGAGEKQTLQCKNWDKFRDWMYAPERHACHKHINPFTGVNHTITRFGYCPEDSPYYPIMKEYFEVHGHLDAVVESE